MRDPGLFISVVITNIRHVPKFKSSYLITPKNNYCSDI